MTPSPLNRVSKPFIDVTFQTGAPGKVGVNGCRIEDIIVLAIDQLEVFQSGSLACHENERAIRALRKALGHLDARYRARLDQGVLYSQLRHETVRSEDENDDFSATGA